MECCKAWQGSDYSALPLACREKGNRVLGPVGQGGGKALPSLAMLLRFVTVLSALLENCPPA